LRERAEAVDGNGHPFSETKRTSRALAATRRAKRALDVLFVSENPVAVAIDGLL
jgi:hypothetical protein